MVVLLDSCNKPSKVWQVTMQEQRVVVTAYTATNPDPVAGVAGDILLLTGEVDYWENNPTWKWIKCVNVQGQQGWVPQTFLDVADTSGTLTRDYSAIELSVQAGQEVTLLAVESGWYWCATTDGLTGWLPISAFA